MSLEVGDRRPKSLCRHIFSISRAGGVMDYPRESASRLNSHPAVNSGFLYLGARPHRYVKRCGQVLARAQRNDCARTSCEGWTATRWSSQKPSPVEAARVQLQRAGIRARGRVGPHFGDGRLTMPTTSRSPTMAPRALTARACGVSRSWETTIGGAAMPRTLRMKSEWVPLPAPGAPPSRINSLGTRSGSDRTLALAPARRQRALGSLFRQSSQRCGVHPT